MQLASLDTTPVLKVSHRDGRFIGGPRPAPQLTARLYALHYGRKKFIKSGEKWSVACMSDDAINGTTATGDSVRCLSDANHCLDCKSILTLALVTTSGPAILETSASIAATIRDHVAPIVSRGLALDHLPLVFNLGATASKRMTFSQVSVTTRADTAAQQEVPRPDDAVVRTLLADFDDHIRNAFTMRISNSRPDLSSAELIVDPPP